MVVSSGDKKALTGQKAVKPLTGGEKSSISAAASSQSSSGGSGPLPGFLSGRLLFGFSPWLLLGISAVLGAAVLVLALRGSRREQEHIVNNYLERADALIWALEAGTRTGMGFEIESRLLQPLIVETARQPGIVYIAVVGEDGRILAHSEPDKIGAFMPAGMVPEVAPADATECMVIPASDGSLFEVWRGFAPLRDDLHRMRGRHGGGGRGRGMMRGHGHGGMWYGGPESSDPKSGPKAQNSGRTAARDGHAEDSSVLKQAEASSFAFVGFDEQPLREALASDRRNNLLTALIVAGLGLAGFISLFWAHGYRTSRRKLKDTEALASEVVTSLPLGLITSDPQGRVRMINETALAMLHIGRREAAGKRVSDIPGLDWAAVIGLLAAHDRLLEREMALTVKGGNAPVSVTASHIRGEDGQFLGHIFILRDIAEMKSLQFEVQKNERLKALGNLAAGVAHEIRNPLSSIKGLASYLAKKAPPGGAEEEAAQTMIGEVNRLNRVVTELLEFAKPGIPGFSEADMNDLVSGALRLVDADVKAGKIRVDFERQADFPTVLLSPERITQALLNIFLNAVQAMGPGGYLKVRLLSGGAPAVAEGAAGGVEAGPPGPGEIAVVVSDTGHGIPEEALASVFTPYFTTKPSGTGLGLAIVHQIIEGHGGRVTVQSKPGSGSVFNIILPLRKS